MSETAREGTEPLNRPLVKVKTVTEDRACRLPALKERRLS
jgi:hypothetical protein